MKKDYFTVFLNDNSKVTVYCKDEELARLCNVDRIKAYGKCLALTIDELHKRTWKDRAYTEDDE